MSEPPEPPRDDQNVPVSQEALLDSLCDEFERALKAGNDPRIEDFLERLPEGARTLGLKELLGIELEIRRTAGEPLLSDDYMKRFARQREIVEAELRRCLGNLGEVTTQRFVGDPGTSVDRPNHARPLRNEHHDHYVEPVPQRVGRFEIRRVLGEGGFGRVLLGHDPILDRAVAIKVPNPRRFAAGFNIEAFISEARHAAKLKHPGLVTVHEVQQDSERPYIVQEYIDGSSLRDWASQERPSYRDIARILIEVSEAVGFAHQHELIHRDLKPANILIDSLGHAHVADFGLAVDQNRRSERPGAIDGTRPYMSPEQFRGETHRLDGRTDLWSLGVVLYELLVHARPFSGRSDHELLASITTLDPLPPRQLDPRVPRELERICLKCLEKRRTDRYTAAADLADDLRHWLESSDASDAAPATGAVTPPVRDSDSTRTAIVPKGLRAFDEHDADFFLELLPGPRSRDGLPESIRFWKTQIEETDPDRVFSVGLLYGPSGCGKSSLVRAGLIPRLAPRVAAVYVEATPQDTEVRLLKGLHKHVPQLPADSSLPESLLWLRENLRPRDRKILIVLDQFEQWLHAHSGEKGGQLVDALRHCDGIHVQCLVLVRDDFYVAVNRLFQELEIPIVEGRNYALVDLFDLEHARKVLTAFGRAYGKLNQPAAELKAEQQTFLGQAVSGLAQEGKVICVRLALFAEMMKGRTWTADSLREVGGTEGVGVTFLEETFSVSTAPPTHRLHQPAARAVLKALLPEMGSDIKGRMQPCEKLLEVSGYAKRPGDFRALLAILESEVRLIAPTEPDATAPGSGEADVTANARHYQLTHDFLVPALRDWLTRKQIETRKGRAELLLETLSTDWNARPDHRRLPTSVEWLSLRLLTRQRDWTRAQKRLMSAADRRHASRLGAVLALMLCVSLGILELQHYLERREHETSFQALAKNLFTSDAAHIEAIITELEDAEWRMPSALSEETLNEIRARAAAATLPHSETGQLQAQLFLAARDPFFHTSLIERLLAAPPMEHKVIAARLARFAPNLAGRLWQVLRDDARGRDAQLRSACALATLDADNADWDREGTRVVVALGRCEQRDHVPEWIERLVPVSHHLIPLLSKRFRDARTVEGERMIVATALVRFLGPQADELTELALDSTADSFPILLDGLKRDPAGGISALRGLLLTYSRGDSLEEQELLARRRAIATIALLRLGEDDEFWSHLVADDDPDFRTAVIDRCARFGADPRVLLSRLNHEAAPASRSGIVLMLAEYLSDGSDELREAVREKCLTLHSQDPDAGVHFAAEWVLGLFGSDHELPRADEGQFQARATRAGWQVTPQGIRMVVVRRPQEFVMGSLALETEREDREPERRVRLEHSFAIGAHEISVEQFHKFLPEVAHASAVTTSPECPMSNVTWYDAVKFCRYLSDAESVPEWEMCYPQINQIGPDMQLPENWLKRRGYRLPTEEEWECACRAGTTTARFFGRSAFRLEAYGRYNTNSGAKLWPVGGRRPNPWGLFDVYGNVLEWCHAQGDAASLARDGGPHSPALHVMRSGTYRSVERENRSAKRYFYDPSERSAFFGLRVARTIPD